MYLATRRSTRVMIVVNSAFAASCRVPRFKGATAFDPKHETLQVSMGTLVDVVEVREFKKCFPEWPSLKVAVSDPAKFWDKSIDTVVEFLLLDTSASGVSSTRQTELRRRIAEAALLYCDPEAVARIRFFSPSSSSSVGGGGETRIDLAARIKRLQGLLKEVKQDHNLAGSLREALVCASRDMCGVVACRLLQRLPSAFILNPDEALVGLLERILSAGTLEWQRMMGGIAARKHAGVLRARGEQVRSCDLRWKQV